MAHMRRTAIAPGQPFNIDENSVTNSIPGSWITFGEAGAGRAVRVQGVYWSATIPGAVLQIRDIRPPLKPGAIWYDAVCIGGIPALDQFAAHLTLFSPFQYYVSGSAGDEIIIYGEYL